MLLARPRARDALDLLKKLAADPSTPRVRLEAVRAASFFTGAGGRRGAADRREHPTDIYLDYVRGTRR